MGNCQAIDAATLVIQHPNGKVEKLYCPVSASEIMKTNPGHYVALLISTTLCPTKPPGENTDKNSASSTTTTTTKSDHGTGAGTGGTGTGTGSVRLTRIKLLRPTDTLALGQVYRLITTQEVMKGLWAKKQAKLKRSQSDGDMRVEIIGREKPGSVPKDKNNQVIKHERHRPRTASASSGTPSAIASRPRTWQPSLHSISEGATPNLQMRRNHTSPSS
ncbi:uncharacterized protein LOC133830376 [Humulus lupulus]|uniref:uncharacterized protein LOC133830376 n=1 Tax=Humulus lupulus TaxID=3486 RepID=UPI002B40BE5E|nr:uncharacterized protein LOC133830376 [Humulus lupulus]